MSKIKGKHLAKAKTKVQKTIKSANLIDSPKAKKAKEDKKKQKIK